MEELRCYGCGAIIQSEDEKKIGFVPKNALDRSQVLCKRCFRLKNYHQLQATNLSDDDFLEILNKIGEKDCLVVYLVDLFDFNGSLIQGLVRHISTNRQCLRLVLCLQCVRGLLLVCPRPFHG